MEAAPLPGYLSPGGEAGAAEGTALPLRNFRNNWGDTQIGEEYLMYSGEIVL